MKRQLSVSTRDLETLCKIIDEARGDPSGEPMPRSVLAALDELVPCDEITYQVMDPTRESILALQALYDDNDESQGTDQALLDSLFWETFWDSTACNYPQTKGDFTHVRRLTEFYSERQLATNQIGEYFRMIDARYEMLMPLPPSGAIDHRLLFWRTTGPDFSDREQLLLTLLRPHFAELHLERRARRGTPLTARQNQVLQFVAAGLTNRQIAKRLHLSEGTVRRHLENIFERLEVQSRAAAVARLDGDRYNTEMTAPRRASISMFPTRPTSDSLSEYAS